MPRHRPRDVARIVAPFVAILVASGVVLSLIVLTWPLEEPEPFYIVERARIEEEVEPLEESPPEEEVKKPEPQEIELPDVQIDWPGIAQPELAAEPLIATVPRLVQPEAVALVRSPVRLAQLSAPRGTLARQGAIRTYGGSAAGEDAVIRALRYLARQQLPDGSWQARGEGDATAFALLAFLAHGETPLSPEFGSTVSRALERLRARHTSNMATYALVEAAAIIRTPVLSEMAEDALSRLLARQKAKVSANAGGVVPRYCAVMSLVAARLAHVKIPPEKVRAFVEGYLEMRDKKKPEELKGKGVWHYMVAAVCLQYLGHGEDPPTRRLAEHLSKIWPAATLDTTEIACCPVRSNYFSTLLFFNAGGDLWTKWNAGMTAAYVATQTVEGNVGYWRCADAHIGDQPFWPTCYIALQLMTYYRYLPTNSTEAWGTQPPTDFQLKNWIEVEVEFP